RYMLMFRSARAEQVLLANDCAALLDAVLAEGLKQGYFTEEDRKAYVEAWSQPGALTGGLNYYRAAGIGPPTREGTDWRGTGNRASELSSLTVRVPTLVIWGEKDEALLTGNLEGFDGFVPDLTVKRIPDGSHWVIHEQPELVNGYIREFIEGIISCSPEPQK
ncbi:MAG: alpha/beta hydrolase, partial [Chloroflexi bacterium]|nr:alpha/beta hydrolase [Chloroflexota bacterium]